jgi:hypothetical protein
MEKVEEAELRRFFAPVAESLAPGAVDEEDRAVGTDALDQVADVFDQLLPMARIRGAAGGLR